MQARQFREHIVRYTLGRLHPEIRYSKVAEELLMLTWAHESDGGKYLKQVGGGPAVGVFQMEPATFFYLAEGYLKRPSKRTIQEKIVALALDKNLTHETELTGNLYLATAMARLRYYVVKEPLPESADPVLLAKYWAKHYQTQNDPDKMAEALFDYERFVNDR